MFELKLIHNKICSRFLLGIFAICFLAIDLESSYCNEMDLLLFVDNPSVLCIFAGNNCL